MTIRRLSCEAFEAACRLIETTARPLEIARLRHAFAGGAVEPVWDALCAYQNPDGGFGRGLEPDLRAEESSALCTSVAFQVLRSTQVQPKPAFIAPAIQFLLARLDGAEGHWRIIPPTAGRSPHAPWWEQAGREDDLERFALNPSAEILGYLFDHQELVPAEVLTCLSERVLSHLSGLEEIKMHDLLCCLRLFQTESLPEAVKAALEQRLRGLIAKSIAYSPEEWSGYCLRPLQVVDRPGSPYLTGLEEAVALNLDYEIASQDEAGGWTPTWDWGGSYPQAWEEARREWSGILTLEKLLLLKKFGRIEAVS